MSVDCSEGNFYKVLYNIGGGRCACVYVHGYVRYHIETL